MDLVVYIKILNAFLGAIIVILGIAAANKYSKSRDIKLASLIFALIGVAMMLKELTGAASDAGIINFPEVQYNLLETFSLLVIVGALYFAQTRLSIMETNECIKVRKKKS